MTEWQKIQQHVFTRERGGVFRTNEGFDTIALSPPLLRDKRFVQNVLHPFCVYKAPQELLRQKSAVNSSQFPDSLTVFTGPNNELVIGRSIYVNADFTGQRSTYFTHQFVIPESRREEFLKEPARLFSVKSFIDSYDIRKGTEVPELVDLESQGFKLDSDSILSGFGISKEKFKQLLYAIMMSINPGKQGPRRKIYVALDVDVHRSSEAARYLSAVLYSLLPYTMRRHLGVVTFNSEPESRSGIHLTFVEKGSIAQVERSFERDVLFDFSEQLFRNVELPGNEHIYLDFVWENRNNSALLTDFFTFCDEALQGLGDSELMAVTYYQLCGLYQINEDQSRGKYVKNRPGTITGITILLEKEAEKKPAITDLFQVLIKEDMLNSEFVPDKDYIGSLLAFSHSTSLYRDLIISALVLFSNYLIKRETITTNTVSKYWIADSFRKDEILFPSFIARWAEISALNSEGYVRNDFRSCRDKKEFLLCIQFWYKTYKEFLNSLSIIEEAQETTCRVLKGKSEELIMTAKSIILAMKNLQVNGSVNLLATNVIAAATKIFIEELELQKINYDQWKQLDFLVGKDSLTNGLKLDLQQDDKLRIINAVYFALNYNRSIESECLTSWQRLGDQQQVAQKLLKSLLKNRIERDHLPSLLFAFYSPQPAFHSRGLKKPSEIDYFALFEFMRGSNGSKLAEFILWAEKENPFSSELELYKSALHYYFVEAYPELIREREVNKRLLELKSSKMRAYFKAIRKELSPFRRFIHKYRSQIRIVMMVLIGFLLLSALAILVIKYGSLLFDSVKSLFSANTKK
ncbi:hypothetical protein [Paenibacillus thalictri]|uniref:Uncharacterized protein n=1 Tax=Paenibacillus thalictri TaxID=2527873 RepID=A0A4Q9DVC4_9BACL|nr:hypothetical protein [Paenibacillus thalictri]TBL80984.1 hypothetical protein EYB31_02465 [Paenibacillus thalictri]